MGYFEVLKKWYMPFVSHVSSDMKQKYYIFKLLLLLLLLLLLPLVLQPCTSLDGSTH